MFKSQNFCHIASNNRNQVKVGVFVYRTTDSLATVLASGYFNDRIIDINLHDLIIHEQIDNADATKVKHNLLCVTERTLENVGTTVIKTDWEEEIDEIISDGGFVRANGSVPMLAPLRFRTQSPTFRGGIGAGMNGGVYFYDLDSSGNILPSFSSLTTDGLFPNPAGNMTLGSSTRKWNDAHIARVITGVINNGYDIAVPVTNSADTLALKSEVDLAANSGRMITDQGVWYAKMYAATVAPSAENGTNYADFSQTDGQGNPIIVIYERQSGAWVQSGTITPPAEYDGYVPITSKIWDIAEQAGQQGGRVLWNHQSKDFTPYPQIISFENAALTGVSTAPTPTESSPNNQIVNKEYVDNKASQQGYHPDLFDVKWADHICNDVQWLRADTFSWQSGAVYQAAYQHLAADIPTAILTITVGDSDVYSRYTEGDDVGASHPYCWNRGAYNIYTDSETPSVGDNTYSTSSSETVSYHILETGTDMPSPETETIAGITISYYEAADGHKLVLPDQESNVAAIYAATGVAWYYILDTVNQRFKLPRTKFGVTGLRDTVGNYVAAGLPNITGSLGGLVINGIFGSGAFYNQRANSQMGHGNNVQSNYALDFSAAQSSSVYGNSTTVQPPATQMYLYFYVGNFTQTALENTAGLNAELFNGKVDTGHEVIAFQAPTAANNYTWYRKYADGWVEQGGITKSIATNSNVNVYLPITMSDNNYTVTISQLADTSYFYTNQGGLPHDGKHTTYIVLTNRRFSGEASRTIDINWQVSGMAQG